MPCGGSAAVPGAGAVQGLLWDTSAQAAHPGGEGGLQCPCSACPSAA